MNMHISKEKSSYKTSFSRMLAARSRAIEVASRIVDAECIVVAFLVAAFALARHAGVPTLDWLRRPDGPRLLAVSSDYALIVSVGVLAWLVVTQWGGVYRSHRPERISFITRLYLEWDVLWVLATGFLLACLKLNPMGKLLALYFLSLSLLTLMAKQLTVLTVLRYLRKKGYNSKQVLIYGSAKAAARLARTLLADPSKGYRVLRVLTDRELETDMASNGDSLEQTEAEEIFIVEAGVTGNIEHLVARWLKDGRRVNIVPELFPAPFRHSFGSVAGWPMISLNDRNEEALRVLCERLLNMSGGLALLILLAPMFLIVALLVKCSSPGPLLFVQSRLGRRGQRFRLYKFRTMRADAEKILFSDPKLYKQYIDNNYKLPQGEDPRITAIGRFLRTTSLDELPQLFNVIKGDMNLVGPRPVVPPEIEKYGDAAPLCFSVKPGLTGSWQVNGRSEIEDYGVRVIMDAQYIRERSLRNDIDILFKTVAAVIKREGAH